MAIASFLTRANTKSKTPFHLQPSDVDRRAPLRDQIYELVRMLIIIGQLKPGQVVNEVEIATQLGLSRTPVREAVKRISDEGLIVVRAQNGTFVADFSRTALDEAYLIRNALELESVKKAAANATEEHLEVLEDTIAAHESAILRQRYPEAIRLDDTFHRQIAEISGLSMLWRAVDISKAQMDRGRHLALPQPGLGAVTITQHREIVAALRAHDADRAAEAMRRHLNASLNNTLALLDKRDSEEPVPAVTAGRPVVRRLAAKAKPRQRATAGG